MIPLFHGGREVSLALGAELPVVDAVLPVVEVG
jgi:hypothetical protein